MRKQVDISVCLPTYKRPLMLQEAIASFIGQSYQSAELIIIDDASDPLTGKIVKKFQQKDPRIYFEVNKKRLGFTKNLIKTMDVANGKYLFILGDDDMILGKDTLRTYASILQSNKEVGLVLSNILQFNNNHQVDCIYQNYRQLQYYKKGEEALRNMWLKSTYIGGIGLRKTDKLINLFPKDDILFPIVEMVGKLLVDWDAIGLPAYGIGMRVHKDQLGFHVMKKKRAVGRERHAYLELYEISDRIQHYIKSYKKQVSTSALEEITHQFLLAADTSILFAEGTYAGKRDVLTNAFLVMKQEKRIKRSLFFWLQLVTFLVLPQIVILLLKELIRKTLRKTLWKQEAQFFYRETQRYQKIIYAK